MNTKINSGRNEVISSGSVLSFKNEPIIIVLSPEIDPLTFTFRLTNDENQGIQAISLKITGTHSLDILLNKFHDALGTGNKEPFRVGHINNRALYLNFRVIAAVESDIVLHYSFYLEEAHN